MKIIDKGRLTSKATKAKHYFDKTRPLGSARNPIPTSEPQGDFAGRIAKIEAQFISGERYIGDKISQEKVAEWTVPSPQYPDKE